MFNTSQDCEVSILVNGRHVSEVHYAGHTYIEGRKNSIYELQIRNKTPNRILAIPAVDGLNVLDGENCGKESPGYVVDPWGVITIPGWKVDNNQAAKFVFKPQSASSSRDKTYSESTGSDPDNQGIIGVMVFREKITTQYSILRSDFPKGWDSRNSGNPPPFINQPFVYCASVGSACDSFSSDEHAGIACNDLADAGKSLGTGFGEATGFQTQDVEFERATENPESVFVMYYDTLQGLKKMGVPVEQLRSPQYGAPNPFPASPNVTGGCTPPPGWNSKNYRK